MDVWGDNGQTSFDAQAAQEAIWQQVPYHFLALLSIPSRTAAGVQVCQ